MDEQPIVFPDARRSELERAIGELVERAHDVLRAQGRLRQLLAATRSVAEELDLPVVLERITRAALELSGARYGALGVIGPHGGLEQFVHVGMSNEQAALVGHLPRGEGLLGALVHDPQPVRLEHLSSDERSAGFPAHHPPMESFIGVPIRVRGEVFGNLYLTESTKGAFSEEDEELLVTLAAAAGVAIENARLYGETKRRQEWAIVSADVSAALLAEDVADPLRLIAEAVMALTDARVVAIVGRARSGIVVQSAWGDGVESLPSLLAAGHGGLNTQVIDSGNPAATTALHTLTGVDDGTDGPAMAASLPRVGGIESALLVARDTGAPRFDDVDLEMIADFATHAGVAMELREARRARQRVELLEDRSRIARDLHDNVIQRLFAAGLSVNAIDTESLPSAAGTRLHGISDLIDEAIAGIRTSVFALRTPEPEAVDLRMSLLTVLDEFADAFPTPPRTVFEGDLGAVASSDLAADVQAALREGLANVARHADASDVDVLVRVSAGVLALRIADDGRGHGEGRRSSGTGNLGERAARWRGSSGLRERDGGGTVFEWTARLPGEGEP